MLRSADAETLGSLLRDVYRQPETTEVTLDPPPPYETELEEEYVETTCLEGGAVIRTQRSRRIRVEISAADHPVKTVEVGRVRRVQRPQESSADAGPTREYLVASILAWLVSAALFALLLSTSVLLALVVALTGVAIGTFFFRYLRRTRRRITTTVHMVDDVEAYTEEVGIPVDEAYAPRTETREIPNPERVVSIACVELPFEALEAGDGVAVSDSWGLFEPPLLLAPVMDDKAGILAICSRLDDVKTLPAVLSGSREDVASKTDTPFRDGVPLRGEELDIFSLFDELRGKYHALGDEGAILPGRYEELGRDVFLRRGARVGGGVFGREIVIDGAPVDIAGSVHARGSLVLKAAKQEATEGSVAIRGVVSTRSLVVEEASDYRCHFHGDVFSDRINLHGALIRGNVICNEAILRDCVVLGGVFSSGRVVLENVILGTFRVKSVEISPQLMMFYPFAMAEEPFSLPDRARILSFISLRQLLEKGRGAGAGVILVGDEDVVTVTEQLDEGEMKMHMISLGPRILDLERVRQRFRDNKEILETISLGGQLDPRAKTQVSEQQLGRFEKAIFALLDKPPKRESAFKVSLEEMKQRATEGAIS